MWIKDRLAVLTTPKNVGVFATAASEQVVKETLRQRYRPFKKLNPVTRAGEWASMGIVDVAASYLRRSILRPSQKKEVLHYALINKFKVLWDEGDVEGVVKVAEQIGNLRMRHASITHIFS